MKEGLEHPPQRTASTITGAELQERIYAQGEVDSRFLYDDEGGVFEFPPLESHRKLTDEGVHYSIVEQEGKIVGVASVYVDPRYKTNLYIDSVSVDKNLKGTRISDTLLREIFRFAKESNRTIVAGRYTEEGEERLQHKMQALSKEFSVPIVEDFDY